MKLVADLHTHSLASGHAYSTIKEMAEAAAKKGLEILAVTEHGPSEPGAPHAYYFYNLYVLPKVICGVEVLTGVEANILGWEGQLDLDKDALRRLDVVNAGFHTRESGTVEENTATMVKAIASGWVDVIVHPGNPQFPIDAYRVVEAVKEQGIALEINNSSLDPASFRQGSGHNCLQIAKLAKEAGINLVVGSDAHWAEHVGEFARAIQLLQEAGVGPEQILNTSAQRVREYFRARKEKRQQLWLQESSL